MMKIKNFKELIKNSPERKIVLELIEAALHSIETERVMRENFSLQGNALRVKDKKFKLDEFENIYVVGAGKASGEMAACLEKILGKRITEGWVNSVKSKELPNIKVIKAGHPTPNAASVKGAEKILKIAENAGERDLVICLISGGGSALMCLPAKGIKLQELQKVNDLLVNSKARIQEINAVRKHISRIKGGKLAEACYPAHLLAIIISDVVGDNLGVIASGPTSADKSTYKKAIQVLKKYKIGGNIPKTVKMHLKKGVAGKIKETPKPGNKIFQNLQNVIILNNLTALNAMKEKALSKGIACGIYSSEMEGEAKNVGKELVKEAIKRKKEFILLAGGETTVTIKGRGKGGRNQELVLGAVKKIEGKNVIIASFGSDGIDGNSKAAGAIADGNTIERGKELGLNRKNYLQRNDSNSYFKKLKDEIITGYTGTNVMDFQIVFVKKSILEKN